MENIEEVWKPITGFEGSYEVSNLGRIKSLERFVRRSNGSFAHHKEKILQPCIDNCRIFSL